MHLSLLLLNSCAIFLASAIFSFAELKVVSTNSIIADWVNAVGGNKIQNVSLVDPNSDTHSFEPTPQDAAALAKADIVFENGLGLEFWLDSLYSSSNSQAQRVSLAPNLPLIAYDSPGAHGHKHTDRCCQHSGHYDPHVWLDVQNAIIMVQEIEAALAQRDPDNADFFKANSQAYIEKLQALDEWIVAEIRNLPKARRLLVTNHNNFAYFAKRYGFELVGNALRSSSTESVDPSAHQFVALVKVIKKRKVPAIFAENIQSGAVVKELAKESGLQQPKVLYTEALSSGSNQPANNYIDLMKYNVSTLVEELNR